MKKRKIGLFVLELILAIIIAVACSLIGMSNLLFESNQLYPGATDIMGHMTKVVYISEQLLKGQLPSWFPYWYNGSSVIQYHAPFSYYLMVPIYWAVNNIMLTFKIYWAVLLAIGGFGVWTFCYRKIGRGCGLLGIIAFCLQPILLQFSYREGVIALGPIYAIMPWLLLVILSLVKKPTRSKYFGTTLLITCMILSHAMHAFMIFLAIVMALLIFILIKRIRIRDFFTAVSCIVFSGILTAVWSLALVTQLENSGISYNEAVAYTTANIRWFIPDGGTFFYFSVEVSVLCLIGLICYIINKLIRRNNGNHEYYGLACIILTIITAVFSFVPNLPGFKYMPFASSIVTGKTLILTAVSGAVLCAYSVYMLWNFPKVKLLLRPITIGMAIYVGYALNPFEMTFPTTDISSFNTMTEMTDNKADAFDKGRYQWLDSQSSDETYYAYLYNYNICNGWNIEGTLQNKKLNNHDIALSFKNHEYMMKEIAFWNIRYLLMSDKYQELTQQLENEMNFRKSEGDREGLSLYVSDMPSSYYLTDSRNALVIGEEMQGFSVFFPYFVQGKSADLLDYTDDELLKFELIYIMEPKINTITKKNNFEAKVTDLVNKGVTVIIEPLLDNVFELFGVRVHDEELTETVQIITTEDNPYEINNMLIVNNSNLAGVRALYYLDDVYVNFQVPESNVLTDVIGAKNVGAGKVIFIGAHLSRYLDVVYACNNGLAAYSDLIKENSNRVEELYSGIFSYYNVNMDYMPEVFDSVTEHHWDYDGGTFTYESEEAQEITISVTYNPRWTATLDGKEIPVGQSENLITLMLPEGQHTVELHYGMTTCGKIGYLISAIGMFLFLIKLLFWNGIMRLYDKISVALGNYLQIYSTSSYESEFDIVKDITDEMAITVEEMMKEEEEYALVTVSQVTADKEDSAVTEDDSDISIQYRTIKEDDIKVDIIVIDEKSSLDSGMEECNNIFTHETEGKAEEKIREKTKKEPEGKSKYVIKNEMRNSMAKVKIKGYNNTGKKAVRNNTAKNRLNRLKKLQRKKRRKIKRRNQSALLRFRKRMRYILRNSKK